MNDVQTIKSRFDIVEYINRSVELKKQGRHFKACCPFHNEKTPSFVVNPDRQTWHCFGACGTGGDILSFIMTRDGVEFYAALEMLADEAGIALTKSGPLVPDRDLLYEVVETAVSGFERMLAEHPGAGAAREYLASRGVSAESIARFRIGWHPGGTDPVKQGLLKRGYAQDIIQRCGLLNDHGNDTLSGRLIFPLFDIKGRPVALAGRDLTGKSPAKYINSVNTAIFDRSDTVYGYHLADRKNDMVIVEGYLDVIQAHQAGFTNTVACMGTTLTQQHINRFRGADRLFLAFDGDEAGLAAADKNARAVISIARDVRICILPAGNDPDDIIKAGGWGETLNQAVPAAEFIIDRAVAGMSQEQTVFEKSRIVSELSPILTASSDVLYNDANLQLLATRLGMSEQAVSTQASAAPKPRITEQAAAPTAPTHEWRLISGVLNNRRAFGYMFRVCREIGIPVLDRDDFRAMPHEWDILMEAFDQDDVDAVQYAQQHGLEPDPNIQLDIQTVRVLTVRLRLRNIQDELDAGGGVPTRRTELGKQRYIISQWLARPTPV